MTQQKSPGFFADLLDSFLGSPSDTFLQEERIKNNQLQNVLDTLIAENPPIAPRARELLAQVSATPPPLAVIRERASPQREIVEFLQSKNASMAVEEISASTGIIIDVVVTACAILIEDGWLQVDKTKKPDELYVSLSASAPGDLSAL